MIDTVNNSALTNPYVTINGTNISLGGTITNIITSDTEPSVFGNNIFWFDSTTGVLKFRYGTVWLTVVGDTGAPGYTGSTGPAGGYTGSVGFSGSQGVQGPAGGYTGSVGFSGSTGIGFVGSRGGTGATGFTGSLGYTGPMGFVGSQGLPGVAGPAGGYTGSASTAAGYTGSTGAIGYYGSFGYTGSAGYHGSRGYSGSRGESTFTTGDSAPSNPTVGDRWFDTVLGKSVIWVNDGDSYQWVEPTSSGFLGATGYFGSTGYTGSIGIMGYAGSQGPPDGYTGSRGLVGYVGSTGSLGYTGSIGYTGSTGAPGLAGYMGSKGESSFYSSDTAPANPVVGDRWFDTVLGKSVIWVQDGDSYQWVEPTSSGYLGATGYTGSASSGYTGSAGLGIFNYTETAPTSPQVGDRWFDAVLGKQVEWIYDGDSYQWVEFASSGFLGATGYSGSSVQGYTGSAGLGVFNYADTAPVNPQVGDRWFDSVRGKQVEWIYDGDSYQWVEFAASGFLGLQGYTGSIGLAGTNGYTGSQGPQGFQGPAGGYTGSVGFVGSQGIQGPAGGYTGSIGYAGSASSVIGYTGSLGGIGAVGFAGSIGYTGSVGFAGSIGGSGYTGSASNVIGFTGSVSTVIGYTGSIGYSGSRGPDGYLGSRGESTFTASVTPPLAPVVGDRWFDTVLGKSAVWVKDEFNNYQWVEPTSSGYLGATGYVGSSGYTGSASTEVGYTGSIGPSGGYAGSVGNPGYTGSAGGAIPSSTTPATTIDGALWLDTESGTLGVYYSGAWLSVNGNTGYTGSAVTGYAGSSGYAGSAGPAGGYTGSAGTGYAGSSGYAGSAGYAGSNSVPGGSSGHIQYNSSGGFGGSTLLSFTGTNLSTGGDIVGYSGSTGLYSNATTGYVGLTGGTALSTAGATGGYAVAYGNAAGGGIAGSLYIGAGNTATGVVNIGTAGTTRIIVDYAGNVGFGLTPVANNGLLQVNGITTVKAMIEAATITAAAPTATTNFDAITQSVQYYTSNTTTNFTLNIRGNGTTTLNTVMTAGQSLTIALIVINGASAFYPNVIQIDTAPQTVKWQGAVAPTGGTINAVDSYAFTIIKTAGATYTVLGSQSKFA